MPAMRQRISRRLPRVPHSLVARICRLALVLAVAGVPSPATGGSVVSVETTGVTTGALFAVTGTGFDAAAANNQLTFTPAAGAPVTVAATSSTVVDASRGVRRLSVRVPAGLPIGAASVRVLNTVTADVTDVPAIQILALDAPRPAQAAPGTTGLAVVVTAQGAAAFVAGQTRVTFGAGISVRAVTVQSANALTATIDIGATAATGARTISVTVPRQSLILPSAFTVASAPPDNQPPSVSAGPDVTLVLPGASTRLDGTATDDGLPAGSTVTVQWSRVSGPAEVVFGTPDAPVTTATFSAAGTYVLELRASDGSATASDAMTVVVNRPANVAPTVNAGLDASITLPTTSVGLSGTVSDDGNPGTQPLVVAWSKLSGPGEVVFANPSSSSTTATMTVAGAYQLQLSANDGEATSSDVVTITVNPAPNAAPTVDAGADTSLTLPQNQLTLLATAADDGNPVGSVLTYAWSRVSGPGVVEFASPSQVSTTATFGAAGVYVLQFSASDGDRSAADTVTVTINPAPAPTNQAPVVTATATPSALTLPDGTVTLAASAVDDGKPSGSLSYAWSRVSGPLGMAFDNAAVANTTATVSQAGTFVLRVTVSDGELSSHADVTIVVAAEPPPPPPPPPPTNTAPSVTAAASPSSVTLPTASVALNATATDDGLPGATALGYQWTKQAGPGTVSFSSVNAASTNATFSSSGSYTLRIEVNDGALTSFADVTVTVNPAPPPPPPTNAAPQASASASPATITLPSNTSTLSSTATDDGLPTPALSYRWSTVSGPAPVTFANETGAQTQATFTASGAYVLRVSVSDGQDTTVATVNVTVNPGAPPPPSNRAPTARPGGPYVGTVGAGVALSGRGSSDPDGDALTYAWSFGDGSEATSPAPVHTWNEARPFTITLTVTDTKGASHTATSSVTVGPAVDRAPPSVTLVAPSQALPGEQVVVTADAVDNVGIASLTFTIDNANPSSPPAPYQRTISIPTVAAPGTKIAVRATATDPSNNSGSASATITVIAAPDAEPPTVSLTAPETASPGQTIVLTATAADNVGVASVRFSTGAATIATDATPPYTTTYVIPASTAVGSLVLFTARATDFASQSADASATVAIVSAPDTTAPTVTVVAPATVPEGTTFDVDATAADNVRVAAVRFDVDDVPVATVTSAPFRARLAVPSTRGPGSVLSITATATDTANLSATASASTLVTGLAEGTGLITGEVYDDATGLPLGGAAVRAVVNGVERTTTADARGRFAIPSAAGMAAIRVTHGGYTVADRRVVVPDRGAVEMVDARLTPTAPAVTIDATLGGSAGDAQAGATFVPGALAATTSVQVTAIGAQGLRGLLPAGWSPVGAIDVAPAGLALAGDAIVSRANAHGIGAGVLLAVATWDETAGTWRFVEAVVVGASSPLTTRIATTGQVVWLLPDAQPAAPPVQAPGTALTGLAAGPVLPADATVTVSPDPRIAVYAPDVDSRVSASLVTASPLSSGLLLRARLVERYDFIDAPRIAPEPFVQDLVFYQFPGAPSSPAAQFTVSPSVVFDAASLAEGVIGVELVSGGDVSLSLIGREGGRVSALTGETFTLAPDITPSDIAARIERLHLDALGLALPASLEAFGAAHLSLNGVTLAQSGVLAIPRPQALVDDTGIVVARLTEVAEATRLEFVGVGRIAGDTIVSETAVTGLAASLPGVRNGGRYVFLRLTQPFGLAFGVVRGVNGAVAPGVLVTTSSLPLVAISANDGGYVVPALAGTTELTATDVASSDAVTVSVAIVNGGRARADLRLQALAPRVTSVTPVDGEGDVALGAPVVLSFSEPIATSSASAIVLETAAGQMIPGEIRWSDGNRVATLRATDALASKAAYRVRVTTALQDAGGRNAAEEFTSTFTTIDLAPRPTPPAGAISATVPGATQRTTVSATQGTAGLRDEVKIHNLTRNTFQVALVNPDGSFTATLDAKTTDKLRIGITTPAGVQTTIDLARFSQENPDGSISSTVDASGGTLLGPNGIEADVPSGAFPDGAVVTLQYVPEGDFPMQLTAEQKTLFQFTGGIRVDFGGATPLHYIDLSLPAQGGETPEDRWVLGGVEIIAGQQYFTVADTARLVGSRIRTSSPPCPGVLAARTYGLLKSLRPVGLAYGKFPNPDPWAGVNDAAYRAQYQQLMMFSTPFLGPLLSGVTPWGVVVDGDASNDANICLPALSGRVTVTPNAQDIVIAGANLTPADREILVTNTKTGQRFSYPRNVAEFRRDVPGEITHTYEVFVQTSGGLQPVGFEVKRGQPGFTTVRVDMDQVALATTAILIRNTSLAPAGETTVPVTELDVRVRVAGSAEQADYQVKAVTGSEVSRAVAFTLESPNGPGSLVLKVIPLTIDPGTITTFRNLSKGTSTVIPDALVVEGRGGVTYAFDGDIADRFAVEVSYPDGSQLPQSFVVPQIKVYSVNPDTGKTTQTFDLPVPPQDEPFNLGAVSGDKTRPFIVSTPENLSFFDPQSFLTFRFSEGLDRQSVLAGLKLVDGQGNIIEIDVRLTELNRVVTVIPRAPLKLGQTYTLSFEDVTDASNNTVVSRPVQIKVFQPRRLGETFLTGQAEPPRHLELWRADDPTQATRTYAMQGKVGLSIQEPVVTSFDLTDSDTPAKLFEDTGGFRFFEVEDWGIATGVTNMPLRAPNICTGQSTFTGTLGVMARQSQSSTLWGFSAVALDIFDLTNPAAPCRFGVKNLAGTNLENPGAYEGVGYAKSVALLAHESGVLAFTAIQFIGLTSTDIGQVIGNDAPKVKAPIVPGNYRSVDVNGGKVIALEQSAARVDVFDPSLSQLASVSLSLETEPFELDVVDAFQIDRNEDGVIDQNELRTLVFVAGLRGMSIVDITELGQASEIAFVPYAGALNRVSVDREHRRVMASTGGRWMIIDFSTPKSFYPGSPDDDQDGVDDRIVWRSPGGLYAGGGGRLLAVDGARGLVYTSSGASGASIAPVGIDTWALNSLCCDARIDMTRNFETKTVDGGRSELIQLEIKALQKGMAAGLAAATSCGVDIGLVTILEQGSGSCIWKPNPTDACTDNYQPGLSDHDYEVFIPDQFFAGAPGDSPADCVAQTLSDQFINADGTPKEVDVDGRKVTFDDITFFPFRKDGFEAGRINILPPQNKSGDTSGDLAMGRQQLLLLWLLGGEYVNIPGYNVKGTPLSEILARLSSQTFIPQLEGYEWANLQKFNLYKTKAFLRIAGASNATHAYHDLFIKQLHDAGKAGIRTVFARMVADPRTNRFVTRIRRDAGDAQPPAPAPLPGQPTLPAYVPAYSADACLAITSADTSTWTKKRCSGFEDFVASTAARTITELQLDLFTPQYIFEVVHKFWRVKGDVQLPTRKDIRDDGDANAFIAAVANFIDDTIQVSQAAYAADIPSLPAAEQQQRGTNLNFVFEKTTKAKKGITLQVVPRVSNAGFRAANDLPVVMYRGIGTAPGTRVKPKAGAPALKVSLAGGETKFLDDLNELVEVEDDAAERNLSDNEKYIDDRKADYFSLGDKNDAVVNPPLDLSAEPGVARWVAFTIDLDGPKRNVRESDRTNNYGGFFYYILDVTNPAPPVSADARVPFPLGTPGTILEPDAECDPPSELWIFPHSIDVDGITYHDVVEVPLFKTVTLNYGVTNLGKHTLDGVQVCSTLTGKCTDHGALAPGQEDLGSQSWTAPGQSGQRTAEVAASSVDGGSTAGPPLRVIVGCEAFTIVDLDPSPNPAGNSTVQAGGTSFRYYRIIDRETGLPVANSTVEVEVKGPNVLTSYLFTTDEDGVIGTNTTEANGDPGFLAGVRIPVPPTTAVGAKYTVTAKAVDNVGDCISDVTWDIDVVERTFTATGTAGSAVKLSGKIYKIIDAATKTGQGLELQLEAGLNTGDKSYQVTSGIALGVEAGLKAEASLGPSFDIKAGGEQKGGGTASAGLQVGLELALNNKYVFASPMSVDARAAFTAASAEPIFQAIRFAGAQRHPVMTSILDALIDDPFNTETYRTAAGAQLQVAEEAASELGGLNLSFGKSDDLKVKDFGIKSSSTAKLAGTITLAGDISKAVNPQMANMSIETRGDFSFDAGYSAGISLLSDIAVARRIEEWINKELKGFLHADGRQVGAVKFELPINLDTLKADRLVVTQLQQKRFGASYQGDQVVDQGDNYRRSLAFTIKFDSPEKTEKVLESAAIVQALLGVTFTSPASAVFTLDKIGEEMAVLLSYADEYEEFFEDGGSKTYPYGLTPLVKKLLGATASKVLPVSVDYELKLDTSTKYRTKAGRVVKGRILPLEQYPENDPLIPVTGPARLIDIATDLEAFYDKLKAKYNTAKKVLKGIGDELTARFSPSGVDLQLTAPEPTDLTAELIAFKYGRKDAATAPVVQDAMTTSGRTDVPHNGIGGFFLFGPIDRQLAAPARLTIRWLDDEITTFDESSIRIYRWNETTNLWDLVGGTVNAADNSVTTFVDRLGTYTAAPAMPAGIASVTASAQPVGPQNEPRITVTSTPLTMNVGGAVPDGTLFTVFTTELDVQNIVQVGTILTPDADPVTPGTQVPVTNGTIAFEAELPVGYFVTRVVAWPTNGGTTYIDRLVPTVPQP